MRSSALADVSDKIVRSFSCYWLARLNSHAKHAPVNFIIHLDKLGRLYSPRWGRGGGGGTPYNGLYGEAPPERGNFFRLGFLQHKVYKRVTKSVIQVSK